MSASIAKVDSPKDMSIELLTKSSSSSDDVVESSEVKIED